MVEDQEEEHTGCYNGQQLSEGLLFKLSEEKKSTLGIPSVRITVLRE